MSATHDRSAARAPQAGGGGWLHRLSLLGLLLLGACSGTDTPDPPHLEELPEGVTVRIRGHQEVVVREDGTLMPRWLGPDHPIGVCLDAPLAIDTSQWQVRLSFAGEPAAGGFVDQPRQAGTTLCFAQPPPADLPSSPDLEVCATLRGGFDNQLYRLPCFRVIFEADGSPFYSELEAASALIGELSQRPIEHRIAALDRLADGLVERGYPLLGESLRVVSVHELFSVGSWESRAEIRRRLAARPPWSTQPEAAVLAAKLAHYQAKLELAEGRSRRAWQLLSEADDLARGVASVDRLAVIIQQALILGRLSAGREAVDRLQAALDDCRPGACRQDMVVAAHQLLGWLLLIDPDATPLDLDRAEASFAAGAPAGAAGNQRERANRLINAALLATRRGEDPRPALDEARTTLESLEPGVRKSDLSAWAEVVEGLAALAAADADGAIAHCGAAASSAPRIAAWGWSCVGRAQRLSGDLAAAAAAHEQAILHHALAAQDSGLDRPLAPGQRADDTYRAARIAVERDDLDRAWRLLEALDTLAFDVFDACYDESAEVLQRLEDRRQGLLSELAWTEPPLAPQRAVQVAPVRRSLLQSLDELQRELLALCRRPLRPTPATADLRAFALEDEVLTLRRAADGSLTAQRTGLLRSELKRRLEQLAESQHSGRLGDEAWRDLARPIADALLPPDPESLGEVTYFALHGVLQRVPLSALPVATSGGGRWLADVTAAVLRPAFVEASQPTADEGQAAPLFVVDPRRTLPSGPAARDLYRTRFPAATVLFGARASTRAVRSALPAASFLHVDTHGHFDSAFPELSRLETADGFLTLADFASLSGPHLFANLSGCHSGRTAPTGDSGRYGLAGVLSRRGTRWVIAHQSVIEDRLGRDFNQVFYREIQAGSRALEAYRTALADLRQRYPVAAWSNLILLGTGDEEKTGRR